MTPTLSFPTCLSCVVFLQKSIVSPKVENMELTPKFLPTYCLSNHCSSSTHLQGVIYKLLVKLMEGVRPLQKSDPKPCKLYKEPSRVSQGALGRGMNMEPSSAWSWVPGGKPLHPFRMQSNTPIIWEEEILANSSLAFKKLPQREEMLLPVRGRESGFGAFPAQWQLGFVPLPFQHLQAAAWSEGR